MMFYLIFLKCQAKACFFLKDVNAVRVAFSQILWEVAAASETLIFDIQVLSCTRFACFLMSIRLFFSLFFCLLLVVFDSRLIFFLYTLWNPQQKENFLNSSVCVITLRNKLYVGVYLRPLNQNLVLERITKIFEKKINIFFCHNFFLNC